MRFGWNYMSTKNNACNSLNMMCVNWTLTDNTLSLCQRCRIISHILWQSTFRRLFSKSIIIEVPVPELLLTKVDIVTAPFVFELFKEFMVSVSDTLDGLCLCGEFSTSLSIFWELRSRRRGSGELRTPYYKIKRNNILSMHVLYVLNLLNIFRSSFLTLLS